MDYIGRNPNEMTGAERYSEIVSIVAYAVMKQVFKQRNQINSPYIERSFTGLPSASKHSCPNRKPTKVRAEKGAKQ